MKMYFVKKIKKKEEFLTLHNKKEKVCRQRFGSGLVLVPLREREGENSTNA